MAKSVSGIPSCSPVSSLLLAAVTLLSGCSYAYLQPASGQQFPPAMFAETASMNDGYVLPLRRWGPTTRPRAIVIAVHGFNDYSLSFNTLGEFLAPTGIMTLAFDQRGFGQTAYRGRWPGVERMIDDLAMVTQLVRQSYPQIPVYIFGESMGGALTIATAAHNRLNSVSGLIVSAPAVWGRRTMNPLLRIGLWLTANTLPWYEVTGRGLKVMASDNRDMLIKLARDPLVIKSTRFDAINGLTDLMDAGLSGAPQVHIPTLLLYGDNDQVVPKEPICELLRMSQNNSLHLITYAAGYHMLTRDRQRHRVLNDVLNWLNQRSASARRFTATDVPAWCRD